MKELSIEEKAKAYDEALEKARLVLQERSNEPDGASMLANLFPELAESEDEKIRKVLLNDFKNHCSEYYCESVNRDMVIAWLEKQGEHAKFRDSIQVGDKVTRNQDGMLVNLSQLSRVAKKQGEQKPVDTAKQEMSDEEYCSLCMDINCDGCPYVDKSKHKEQKPVEWSEEDESRRKKIIHILSLDGRIKNEELSDINNWLKSLRPQKQWKPSDEQIQAIEEALSLAKNCGEESAFDLRTLHEQLKKLREE